MQRVAVPDGTLQPYDCNYKFVLAQALILEKLTIGLAMRRLWIMCIAIKILCMRYLNRWRRAAMSLRLPPPGEVWRKVKSILLEVINGEPGPHVYILPERKYVNFRRGAARMSGSDLVGSIGLSHSEAGDFVHYALLTCENHDVCEMTFTDGRLKVDARIRPAPDTIYKKALQKLTGLTPERLAFDICRRSGTVYLVLDRNFFVAGLGELSDLLAALDEQKPMTA